MGWTLPSTGMWRARYLPSLIALFDTVMHGNMLFSTHYILGTPQQSGGFLVCSINRKTPIPQLLFLINSSKNMAISPYIPSYSYSLSVCQIWWRSRIIAHYWVNVAKHWHVVGRGICHLWLHCFPCYTYVCSVMKSYCPEIWVTLGLTYPPPPPGPPKYEQKLYFFHVFDLNLQISNQIASLFYMYIDMGVRIAGKQDWSSLIIEDLPNNPSNNKKKYNS